MKQRTNRTIKYRLIMVALALIGIAGLGSLPKAQAATCPCNVWGTGAPAGGSTANDPAAVELGVKFKSDVAGTVSGIRFYKSTQNTGTHKGTLWSSTGTKLATANFTNETASGWQTVTFTSPVSVTANTTYVAS
jgi:hypothetical protein